MAINRNENRFGTLFTILSILVISFLVAFTIHKTVPVVSYEDAECGHGCCIEQEDGCHHIDEYEEGVYEEEDEFEADVD